MSIPDRKNKLDRNHSSSIPDPFSPKRTTISELVKAAARTFKVKNPARLQGNGERYNGLMGSK